jgi:uncharacterized YigZ family protein
LRERGSRFVAVAALAESEDDARALRDGERVRFRDATHHVWAFRCSSGEERWDDDGEPAGTGGRPILAAIDSSDVVDVSIVVTRWFGGTKLGTGGLSRAYGGVAAAAIAELELLTVRPGRILRIQYGWPDTGAVATTLDAFGARRVGERHSEGVELDVAIPEGDTGPFQATLREATGGRVTVSVLEGRVRVRCEA